MAFFKTKTAQEQYHSSIKKLVLEPLQKSIVSKLSTAASTAESWQKVLSDAFVSTKYQEHVEKGAKSLADKNVRELTAWHEKKTKAQFRKLFSVDVAPLLREQQTRVVMQPVITANINLIKSIPEELNDQVNIAYQDILSQQGFSEDAVLDMLTQRFSVSNSHAKLIARDQTNKTIGALTMTRHAQAGITKFIWSTSEDERVRPAHQALDGKIFSWDTPPIIGIPGQPILCRCVALPYIEGVSDT